MGSWFFSGWAGGWALFFPGDPKCGRLGARLLGMPTYLATIQCCYYASHIYRVIPSKVEPGG